MSIRRGIDVEITSFVYWVRKVINVEQEKCRTKNEALRNSSIWLILFRRLPIKNHLKPLLLTKDEIWPNTRPKIPQDLSLWKKTSMPQPFESLRYIMCHNSIARDLLKKLSNSNRCNCQKVWSWSRRPEISKTVIVIYWCNSDRDYIIL